ncbi:hypothetical protein EVAR_82006_1 [Eumeta japonica]|uniref:Gustatory receptor n=1 Tax=Eumeta variegata TaxID=151549 RepID=A0A4C1VTR9_EUMVA|nr:hypothetical protein EVAR_82006_1 [Eumeta japonica]
MKLEESFAIEVTESFKSSDEVQQEGLPEKSSFLSRRPTTDLRSRAYISDGDVTKKTIRGILREVLQQPCALECFAGVRIDMSLLPAVLSASATYIIVVLQFMHFI